MARLIYSLAWVLAFPFVLLLLLWRAYKRPAYRAHWLERFGFYRSDERLLVGQKIWIHAVSVGETRAAQPLVAMLLNDAKLSGRPLQIILTHMTPTGRKTGEEIFANLLTKGTLIQAYLPYDYAWAMRRFLHRFAPGLGLVMETEVWPNLLAVAEQERVPVALVNARLSEKSLAKGLRFESLIKPAALRFCSIVAQSDADAKRIALLTGRTDIVIAGSTKFDVTAPPEQLDLARQWRGAIKRPVLLMASSRDGEEAPMLALWKRYCNSANSTIGAITPAANLPLLVIVPRHPERFELVFNIAHAHNLQVTRRTECLPSQHSQVWIGDSMGELFAYYGLADVALIGGSFGGFGSQNCLEAMAAGCPVVVGPSRYNFEHIISEAIAVKAAIGADSLEAAFNAALALLQNPVQRDQMAAQAQAFCDAHQGATRKTLQALRPYL